MISTKKYLSRHKKKKTYKKNNKKNNKNNKKNTKTINRSIKNNKSKILHSGGSNRLLVPNINLSAYMPQQNESLGTEYKKKIINCIVALILKYKDNEKFEKLFINELEYIPMFYFDVRIILSYICKYSSSKHKYLDETFGLYDYAYCKTLNNLSIDNIKTKPNFKEFLKMFNNIFRITCIPYKEYCRFIDELLKTSGIKIKPNSQIGFVSQKEIFPNKNRFNEWIKDKKYEYNILFNDLDELNLLLDSIDDNGNMKKSIEFQEYLKYKKHDI